MTGLTDPEVVHRSRLRVMGCAAELVIVGGGENLGDVARRRLEHLEQCWSRFIDSSDLCRINHAGGDEVAVDEATIVLVEQMIDGWRATGGAFDPTLVVPLVGLGYAASWDDPKRVTSLAAGTAPRTDLAEVAVSRQRCAVRAPAGAALDAGGVGKGLAADLVATEIVASGASGALVSVGGDVRVAGTSPDPAGWAISVEDGDGVCRCMVRLRSGGVATSGSSRRAWSTADRAPAHHLLDPATLRPLPVTPRAAVQATTVAGTAAWAEVVATAALVDGPANALSSLDEHDLAVRFVYGDGTAAVNRSWARYEAQYRRTEETR